MSVYRILGLPIANVQVNLFCVINLLIFELKKIYTKIHWSCNVMVVDIYIATLQATTNIFCYLLGNGSWSGKRLGDQFHVLRFIMFIFEHSWQLKLELINMFYIFVELNL